MLMYRIFHTESDTYMTTRNRKTIWSTPGAAKNAWHCCFDKEDCSFNEQDEYVCVEVEVVSTGRIV